jgi:hypothetical protein
LESDSFQFESLLMMMIQLILFWHASMIGPVQSPVIAPRRR